ncbi:hypothetical protein Taro_035754 [Colocasia esculenta]|uniref:Uncharacterized protein n=1 Tax=Colocasia esculenta TaxID=4460 RepID=A0A843W4R9_COLES|nr:hypothetical protein [Colocasia esculenta]
MNMIFDVPYEDMVHGARSGSSSGRRLSSGRGSFAASASGPSVPPPLASGSGQFTPPPPTVAGASMVPEVEDAVSLQEEGGGSFYAGTLREEKRTKSLSESRPDSLEGARTDMDEVAKSMQHMGRREMARNLHNNESESGFQSRGQQAYKWENELKWPLTFQEVFDKTHKKKGWISTLATELERLRSRIASR